MKKLDLQLLLLSLFFGMGIQETKAQAQITYDFSGRSRTQLINKYTDIFISSPVDNQMLGSVTGLFAPGSSTNRYFEFTNGAYHLITVTNAATTRMVSSRAYVFQWGGIGTIGTFDVRDCCYLDADAFLLDPANIGLVTGPLRLWAHNTGIFSKSSRS